MTPRRTMSHNQLRAERKAEENRAEKLDEKGLCRICGDNPQNPHLSPTVCMHCYKSAVPGGCHANECLEDTATTYQGVPLCEAHLADTVHKEYERYLGLKSELHEAEQRLGFMIIKRDYPTEDQPDAVVSVDQPSEEVNELRNEIKQLRSDISVVKSDIKYSMKRCDNLFPENYEVFS